MKNLLIKLVLVISFISLSYLASDLFSEIYDCMDLKGVKFHFFVRLLCDNVSKSIAGIFVVLNALLSLFLLVFVDFSDK